MLKNAAVLFWIIFSGLIPRVTAQEIPAAGRFAGEIKAFAAWDLKNTFPEKNILFVGSSSIRMWNTASAFPEKNVINRGFGGAITSDVLAYYDTIVRPYRPRVIVFYCGDNDVTDGLPADSVVAVFKTFLNRVQADFPKTKVIYIPIKPSPSRWHLWPEMDAVNTQVKVLSKTTRNLMYADIAAPMLKTGSPPSAHLFLEDGLHLSDAGYAIWNETVRKALKKAGY